LEKKKKKKKKKKPGTNMGVDSLDQECISQTSVFHTLALPFTLKSILSQKKNYGNSNISPCKKKYNLKKKSSKETKILQGIITL
jgi:hypothetical protein